MTTVRIGWGPLVAEQACNRCRITQSLSSFPLRKDTGKYGATCHKCLYKDAKIVRQTPEGKKKRSDAQRKVQDPLRQKDYHLKSSFGISLAEFNDMVDNQNNVCAICKKSETAKDARSGKLKSLHVDHDHETGMVRGLLCTRCNIALGLVRDDRTILGNMMEYLEMGKER